MQDNADSNSDTSDDAELDSASLAAAQKVGGARQKKAAPVLQQLEQRSRQRTHRRKIPPWALKVTAGIAGTKRFFRETIPATLRSRRREITTAAVSFIIHLFVALSLAAWLMPESARDEVLHLVGIQADVDDPNELPEPLMEIVQPEAIKDLNVDSTMQQMLAELDKGKHRIEIDSTDLNELTLPLEDLTEVSEIPFIKGHFGGRSDAGRRASVNLYGGNADSEKAVSLGLDWLQKIQLPDGSWSFDEVGEAGQPGYMGTTDMGATSMALLCYLGSGNTHKSKGKYQETVTKGLAYLLKNAERGASGADLRGRSEGNSGMYVQGIATICLCEAAAMERDDKELKRMAGDAIKFIERAQNKIDGGWRYSPGDRGDTSVAGWQIMALQSAKAGRIKVQSSSILDAKKFLNSVQSAEGALYAYVPGEGPSDSMTAVGLLCRIYLGWKRENPALKAGVEHLAKVGPRPGNIYFNYYATQVLHHWGGDLWKEWNLKMREELLTTQVKDGAGAGSWNVTDSHGGGGGRIYQTTLSLLTLEVYYRHLPIYRRFDDKAADNSDGYIK